LEKPLTIYELINQLVFQAPLCWCSLCCSAPLWVFREQIEVRDVLGSITAQAFTSFGGCIKPLPVWSSGWAHLPQLCAMLISILTVY